MKRDMAQRVSLARTDDLSHQSKVTAARNLIYDRNYAVDSAPVERLLKDESLVPATV
jgi:hypothetical protein